MKIEVFSDIVCPWCYIGKRRLATALGEFGAADGSDRPSRVEVVFRPFQLDPGAPTVATPLRTYLDGRYGSRVGAMMEHAGTAAAGEGIHVDWDRALAVNTFEAHRLLRFALDEKGAAVQGALVEGLFASHFTRGEDLADPELLAARAASVGMDQGRVRAVLASDESVEATRTELDEARRLGIRSVPTFVFEGRWAVEGAQPPELLVRALEQAANPDGHE